MLQASDSTPLLKVHAGDKPGYCDFSAGSTASSVFNLCASTLGAGVLSLPYAMHQTGLVLGIFAVLMIAVITSFSLMCLIAASRTTGYESYEELSLRLFGPRMLLACQLCILLFGFGIIIAYVMVIGDVAEPLLHLLPGWMTRRLCMVIVWACLMLPLSFFPSLEKFRFVSFVGVLSILYLTLAVLIHYRESLEEPRPPVFLHRFNWGGNVLVAMSTLMFALTSHIQVPLIYRDMGSPSEVTTNQVIIAAMMLIALMYSAVAAAGYAEFGEGVAPNILTMYDADKALYVRAAFLAVAVSVIVAFPLNVFPCRFTLSHMLWSKSDSQIPSKLSHLLTVIIATFALLLALCVPNVSVVFALTGSTVSAFICFILPGLFITRLKQYQGTRFLVGAWCMIVFGVFGAIAGTWSTMVHLNN